MRYNSDTGNWEEGDDPLYNPPAPNPYIPPPPQEQLGSFGVPINSDEGGVQNLSYWQSRHDDGLPGAYSVEDMFDLNTGQLKPGWIRTARGYERVSTAPVSNAPGAPNYTGDYSLPGEGGGGFDAGSDPTANWQWPTYTAPEYRSPGPFTPRRNTWDYTPFSYKEFSAPTIEQARNNPGYQFAAQEGINRLESSAAGRGVLRSGMTLKDIIGWGNKFADQNYDQVFNRELTTYGTNRNNAFDAYKTNLDTDFKKFSTEYGIDRDVYDRYATDTFNGNNYRLSASQAEFAPKFDASKLEFADAYQRWKAKLDAATQIATGGPA